MSKIKIRNGEMHCFIDVKNLKDIQRHWQILSDEKRSVEAVVKHNELTLVRIDDDVAQVLLDLGVVRVELDVWVVLGWIVNVGSLITTKGLCTYKRFDLIDVGNYLQRIRLSVFANTGLKFLKLITDFLKMSADSDWDLKNGKTWYFCQAIHKL